MLYKVIRPFQLVFFVYRIPIPVILFAMRTVKQKNSLCICNFSVSYKALCMVALNDWSVWLLRIIALYSCSVWLLCMVALYGCSVWLLCMVALYGYSIWLLCMVALFGCCMVDLYGCTVWLLCIVDDIFKNIISTASSD